MLPALRGRCGVHDVEVDFDLFRIWEGSVDELILSQSDDVRVTGELYVSGIIFGDDGSGLAIVRDAPVALHLC